MATSPWPDSQLLLVGGEHFAVRDAQGAFWDIRGQLTLPQLWSGLRGHGEVEGLTREALITALDTGLYGEGVYLKSSEDRARRDLKALIPAHLTFAPARRRSRP